MDKGTLFTLDVVRSMRKPNFTVQIDSDQTFVKEEFNSWLNQNEIRVLNVAGPRESSIPGIYKQTLVFFKELLK